MEIKSQIEINKHHILYVILIIVLFLGVYSIYLFNQKSEIIDTKDNLELNLNQKETVISVECDGLTDNQLESCIIKTSECIDDDLCLSKKARLIQDEKMCFNISDENLRVGCSAQVTYDKKIQSAVLEDNIENCKSFEDNNAVISCEDNYWYVKSVNTNDKLLCLNISKDNVKYECQER